MKIGIDVRCLLEVYPSGVAYYTKNLLDNIFQIDKKNQYYLFYNSYNHSTSEVINSYGKYKNVTLKRFNVPNKFLNTSINFFHQPKIDKLIGGVDVFFAPNLQFISLSTNCKKIVTVHDISFDLYPEFLSLKRKLWHKFINPKKFVSEADQVIAVSHNTKQDLIKQYKIESNKINVIHSGINPVIKNSDSLLELPEKYILTISTLEPRKNIVSLIHAFNNLDKKIVFKDYYLLIAGSKGWKSSHIYKAARHNSKIKFFGFVSDQQKAQLYSQASVFVYPSFYEGFGFPPLESLSYNTPVIVSNNSSLPEILEDAALYINPYDANDIQIALENMLINQKLRKSFADKAPSQIAKFNWQKTAQQTLKVFLA